MSIDCTIDPRTALVRTKYFSLHPKPLEQWLWRLALSQAAERVFWLHWEEGMRNGDWCSEIPIKRVAYLCHVDPSTVTRAYQALKVHGLLRRQDPGRDVANPFQQATAITEVRLPNELLLALQRTPNRPSGPVRAATAPATSVEPPYPMPPAATLNPTEKRSASSASVRPTRQQSQAMWRRVSEGERARFYAASQARLLTLAFDASTQLSVAEQTELLAQLAQSAEARPKALSASVTRASNNPVTPISARRLSSLEAGRVRVKLLGVGVPQVDAVLRQVIWAVEEGALSRFPLALAINIAIKKVREGEWTKPNRMPPQWTQPPLSSAARLQCRPA